MRGPSTLRGRIAVVAVVTTAGWLTALTVAFNAALSAQLRQQADTVLRTRAEAVASTVEVFTGGAVSIRDVRDDSAIDTGTWIFAGGRAVEEPPGGATLLGQASALTGMGERTVTTGGASPVRLFALPVTLQGRQAATVVVSLSLAPYRQTEKIAVVGSLLLALLLLVGVYLVIRVSTDRALRPVEEMTEQAGRWSADASDHRFGAAPRPAELARLAATLDSLLDRVSAVLRHEQAFSDHLSHELRTPLAAMVAELSLLQSRPREVAEFDRALPPIADAANRMTVILDTLMAAARTGVGGLPDRCDVGEVLQGLARRWSAPPELVMSVPASTLAGVDAGLLERMLSPVLDNARRYAHTQVHVVARVVAGQLRIDIRDDGPGLGPDTAAHLFEPGWRADPHDGHDGAGLGLALVHRLAAAAGGSVRAFDGGPGAAVELSLPGA
ncbi:MULTISPECIES: sensor histidine kinase KdpD [unclassified Frankia]|uniref:sensor histidine kinase n=2 Tax=Frankia TaxID=1854 RepID=UPI001EF4F0C8|nr:MULTISPECIES: HAMP domain-containing sensor histidine kinase [unclassified Frankia]